MPALFSLEKILADKHLNQLLTKRDGAIKLGRDDREVSFVEDNESPAIEEECELFGELTVFGSVAHIAMGALIAGIGS